MSPSSPVAQLRLRTAHTGKDVGFADGGWWPRSLDLDAEADRILAAAALDGDLHRPSQILCNTDTKAAA